MQDIEYALRGAEVIDLSARDLSHSEEAEQSVLGGLLLDDTAWNRVVDVVTAADFYHADHRTIFQHISDLIASGEPVDVLTVAESLERAGKLAEVGGYAYLGSLAANIPGAANIKHYAKIVRERSLRRTLAAIGREVADAAVTTGTDVQELMREIRSRVGALQPASSAARLRCVPLSEIVNTRLDWIIKGLLPRRGLGSIFGEYSCGKSFLAFDIVAAPARGLAAWRGHRVKTRGGAIYIAAEGSGGAGDRVRAYAQHHDIGVEEIALEFVTARVDLRNPGAQLDELVTQIRAAAERIGPVVVIVIDTLARTMPGGSDSRGEDMSAYIENCVALGEAIDAFVLIVHHAGKDPSRGSRGRSDLPCAVDLEIEVRRDEDGNGTMTLNKVRDGRDGDQLGFRLEVVDLGQDEDGDPITSCVVVPSDVVETQHTRQLPGAAKVALQALKEAIVEYGRALPETTTIPKGTHAVKITQWRDRFDLRYGTDGKERSAEAIRKAFDRGREALLKVSAVGISDPYAWVIGQ